MRFSIVTPSYNKGRFIGETIESVLSQEGDFEIEYIIQDGGSTDDTIDIIKSYDELLRAHSYPIKCGRVTLSWYSEKDTGMYDAINKGFAHAMGDILAYINADDVYIPGAFQKIAATFRAFPEIAWLTGTISTIDADSKTLGREPCRIYNQKWIAMGIYGRNAYFITQDSVFWRKELWQKLEHIDTQFTLAGDYYLWVHFAAFAPLWSLNVNVSSFRKTPGQLSENMTRYRDEQARISKPRGLLAFIVKLFFWLSSRSRTPFYTKTFLFLYRICFPSRNRQYIEMDKHAIPHIKDAYSHTI